MSFIYPFLSVTLWAAASGPIGSTERALKMFPGHVWTRGRRLVLSQSQWSSLTSAAAELPSSSLLDVCNFRRCYKRRKTTYFLSKCCSFLQIVVLFGFSVVFNLHEEFDSLSKSFNHLIPDYGFTASPRSLSAFLQRVRHVLVSDQEFWAIFLSWSVQVVGE